MTVSFKKSKVMAFIGQALVRCKITINDKIFEQVNEFTRVSQMKTVKIFLNLIY
jgi:hypothetical protein